MQQTHLVQKSNKEIRIAPTYQEVTMASTEAIPVIWYILSATSAHGARS